MIYFISFGILNDYFFSSALSAPATTPAPTTSPAEWNSPAKLSNASANAATIEPYGGQYVASVATNVDA